MSYPYLSDVLNRVFGVQWDIPIATFGSFVAIAMIVGTWIATLEVKRFERLGLLPKARILSGNYVPVHNLLTDLAAVTAIAGIVGARVFHILEYPAEFLSDPMAMIFTGAGLSIYGGLIFGVLAGVVFLRKRSVPIAPMLDALAPAMILGYGIGRLGCQIAGDGDWGILANMALKPDFLPTWLWAQTYENNIVGTLIPSPGVYPTPIYEAITAFLIFSILWTIRKFDYSKGFMFSVYLLLSGFSRLLIEKIRINSEYHLLGISFTQAELISVLLVLAGLVGILQATQIRCLPKIAVSVCIVGVLTACAQL